VRISWCCHSRFALSTYECTLRLRLVPFYESWPIERICRSKMADSRHFRIWGNASLGPSYWTKECVHQVSSNFVAD
jgi:hypothetical protein